MLLSRAAGAALDLRWGAVVQGCAVAQMLGQQVRVLAQAVRVAFDGDHHRVVQQSVPKLAGSPAAGPSKRYRARDQ